MATSPGVGFGDGGDGHVRFALIENELRTTQAIRNLQEGTPQTRLTSGEPGAGRLDAHHLDATSRHFGDLESVTRRCGHDVQVATVLAAQHARVRVLRAVHDSR